MTVNFYEQDDSRYVIVIDNPEKSLAEYIKEFFAGQNVQSKQVDIEAPKYEQEQVVAPEIPEEIPVKPSRKTMLTDAWDFIPEEVQEDIMFNYGFSEINEVSEEDADIIYEKIQEYLA